MALKCWAFCKRYSLEGLEVAETQREKGEQNKKGSQAEWRISSMWEEWSLWQPLCHICQLCNSSNHHTRCLTEWELFKKLLYLSTTFGMSWDKFSTELIQSTSPDPLKNPVEKSFSGHLLYLRADSDCTDAAARVYSASLPPTLASRAYQVHWSSYPCVTHLHCMGMFYWM